MKRYLLDSPKSRPGVATLATLGSWLLAGTFALAQTSPQAPPPPAPVTARPPANGLPVQTVPGARPPDPPRDGGPLSAEPGKRGPGLIGRIVAVRPYLVQIAAPGNRYVTLALHKGTIINPLGTTLTPGMNIRAHGRPQSGGTIATDRIDLQTVAQSGRPAPVGPEPRTKPRPRGQAGPPRPEGGPPAPQ